MFELVSFTVAVVALDNTAVHAACRTILKNAETLLLA